MNEHPVPQNVTSFQFHLIGDMTLKQFLYLAAGVGFAYLMFVLAAGPFPLVAWPIIVVSALSGIAFAFVPISDRPLDHWMGAFLHAIFQPTQRIWIKNSKKYSENPIFLNRLNLYLSGSQVAIPTPYIPTTTAPLSPQTPQASPEPKPSHEPMPSKEELSKTVTLAHQAQALQVKILEEQRQLKQIKNEAVTKTDPKIYTEEFNNVFKNLQNLVTEASQIKKELASVTNEPPQQVVAESPVKVTVVAPSKPKATQLVLTTFPNVINGVVTDSQGNYLESVVVVIHDRDGLPVRALKSNKLGQFTGSTPLPNGVYTIELEKDQLVFDVLQMELTGNVLPPLKITAKRMVQN